MASAGGEWGRSWWIAFTLVPFGWLAFVAFAYAGRRARRRGWISWAILYGVVFWAATVVASVEELDYAVRQSGGLVMFLGTPVPFLHALAIRRAYLDATSGAHVTAPAAVAAPTVRARPPRRWTGIPVFMVIFGVVGLLVGGIQLASAEPGGIAFVAFGGASILAATLRVPPRRYAAPVAGTVREDDERGLVFPYAAGRARRTTAGVALFVVLGVSMAVYADEFTSRRRYLARPAGILAAAGATATLAFGLTPRRGGAIALTPARVSIVNRRFRVAVPWESIADVRPATGYGGQPLVAVDAVATRAVEKSVVARWATVFHGRSFGHVTIEPQAADADPLALLRVVTHYWRHPDERGDLAAPGVVERFAEIASGGSGS